MLFQPSSLACFGPEPSNRRLGCRLHLEGSAVKLLYIVLDQSMGFVNQGRSMNFRSFSTQKKNRVAASGTRKRNHIYRILRLIQAFFVHSSKNSGRKKNPQIFDKNQTDASSQETLVFESLIIHVGKLFRRLMYSFLFSKNSGQVQKNRSNLLKNQDLRICSTYSVMRTEKRLGT